ncbi:MAG: DUF1475 domain-containing protein [Gammaproteobacteria bacterium]|nr:DUF1475 domain-containing protein [Gammaproteobacteria bacterium]
MINNQTLTIRLLAIFAGIGFVLMFGSIIYAILNGDLPIEGAQLMAMPWGIVSLVDIYLGLLLFSVWVMWREQNSLSAIVWVLLVLSLGNLLSCLYILKVVLESQGSAQRFWLGKNSGENRSDV